VQQQTAENIKKPKKKKKLV